MSEPGQPMTILDTGLDTLTYRLCMSPLDGSSRMIRFAMIIYHHHHQRRREPGKKTHVPLPFLRTNHAFLESRLPSDRAKGADKTLGMVVSSISHRFLALSYHDTIPMIAVSDPSRAKSHCHPVNPSWPRRCKMPYARKAEMMKVQPYAPQKKLSRMGSSLLL